MAHFGLYVKSLRTERDLSQEQFAQRAGLHRNTVNKVERTAATPDDVKEGTRVCLAHGLGLTPEALAAGWRPGAAPQQVGEPGRGIPIINRAPAGEAIDYEHMSLDAGVADDYVPRVGSGIHDPTAFAVEIVGDSMTPEFQEGDIVVCSPQAPVADGQVVFVRFGAGRDHACTVKRLYDRGDEVELVPDNRRYPPFRALKEEIDRLARVVAKWTRYA